MKTRKLKEVVQWVGAVDWDRRLFDELIPLPDGQVTMLSDLKVELLEPVIVKGFLKEEDFKALDRLTDEILKRRKEHNLIV